MAVPRLSDLHKPGCLRREFPLSDEPCTCGRDAALEQVQAGILRREFSTNNPVVGSGAKQATVNFDPRRSRYDPMPNLEPSQRQPDRESHPSPRTQYEYLVTEGPPMATLDEVAVVLNKYGAEGWALSEMHYGAFIFMRPKQ
jgi:hypothetical protein